MWLSGLSSSTSGSLNTSTPNSISVLPLAYSSGSPSGRPTVLSRDSKTLYLGVSFFALFSRPWLTRSCQSLEGSVLSSRSASDHPGFTRGRSSSCLRSWSNSHGKFSWESAPGHPLVYRLRHQHNILKPRARFALHCAVLHLRCQYGSDGCCSGL